MDAEIIGARTPEINPLPLGLSTTLDILWESGSRPLLPSKLWDILRQVSAETGIRVEDILSRDRTPCVAWARNEAMRRARRDIVVCRQPASYPLIGLWFRRHHTTIMSACRK